MKYAHFVLDFSKEILFHNSNFINIYKSKQNFHNSKLKVYRLGLFCELKGRVYKKAKVGNT